MTADIWVGLLAIVVGAPPAYYAIYQGITRDRADREKRIEERLQMARDEGRDDAVQAMQIRELKEQVERLGGGTSDPR